MLGLLLLVVTTSGAALLYEPEYFRATHASLFHHTSSGHPLTAGQAMAVVDRAHPGFSAASVTVDHGVYEVGSANPGTRDVYGVDPGTGRITGKADVNGGVMGFLDNLHACGLTCEGYPGYLAVLKRPMPIFASVTIGGFVLGTLGTLLFFLAVSGIVLWWPGVRRWRHGYRVRWAKGRFARDYDLHKVVGMAAIPFLLVWALTGASFEFPFVNTAWYAVTGGKTPAVEEFASARTASGTPDIGPDRATSAALARLHGSVTGLRLPDRSDPAAYYTVTVASGPDPWRHSLYPGQVTVAVDRHDPARVSVLHGAHGPTLSNTVWDDWRAPVFHYGYAVNGWWRLVWLLFGLAPLILAVTGLSTWLARRSTRRARRSTRNAGQAAA